MFFLIMVMPRVKGVGKYFNKLFIAKTMELYHEKNIHVKGFLLSCPSHNFLPLAGASLCTLCHCGQVISRAGLVW